MRIECPFCGARDLREFTYRGDAAAAEGKWSDEPAGDDAVNAQADRVYLRDNPAGRHRGLWYHGGGCRSWLVIERDVRTHEIFSVAFARGETGR
jgi:methylglutamate dehydrogenase subunit B